MKAMLFAAGKGTRLKPITDTMPKALVPVCGKALLEHVLEKLSSAGFNDVVINVHHFADKIYEYVASSRSLKDMKISFSDESEELLETGGGIKKAEALLIGGEAFLVHNVDILSNLDLKEFYDFHLKSAMENEAANGEENVPELVATLLVSGRRTSRYLLFDRNDFLVGWTNEDTGELRSPYKNLEYPSPGIKKYAFGGVHVMSASIFKYMESFPEAFPIMDFYLAICHKCRIKAYVKDNLRLIDVGKLDSLERAEAFLRQNQQ